MKTICPICGVPTETSLEEDREFTNHGVPAMKFCEQHIKEMESKLAERLGGQRTQPRRVKSPEEHSIQLSELVRQLVSEIALTASDMRKAVHPEKVIPGEFALNDVLALLLPEAQSSRN